MPYGDNTLFSLLHYFPLNWVAIQYWAVFTREYKHLFDENIPCADRINNIRVHHYCFHINSIRRILPMELIL